MTYLIAIDQSTSGTKALLVDGRGRILDSESMPHAQSYPQPGWVEHDPLEIYRNVNETAARLLARTGLDTKDIAGMSLTNQRETVVVWDPATGLPVYPAIVWQCRRTAGRCDELKKAGFEAMVFEKTGLLLDAYFSASKIQWILEQVPPAGQLLAGTMDSWLIWKLTNGQSHATDFTNASRTSLFNIQTLEWDPELLDLFQVPGSMLPEVKSSDELFGRVADEASPLKGLEISGVIGDSQAALFGQKCFEPGMAKATYGTGTSVMMQTGGMVQGQNGLVTSVAWGLGGKVAYALEAIIHSTGDTINWLKDQLQLIESVGELEPLALSLKENEGVYLVPAFVGLGAPYWASHARAAIIGMNRNSGKAHVARAALESIAYQVRDAVDLIESESGTSIMELRVDGGATVNGFLMQFQADMLGSTVRVSHLRELSALGSAYLAGLAFKVWESLEEIQQLNPEATLYVSAEDHNWRSEHHKRWKQAVSCVIISK